MPLHQDDRPVRANTLAQFYGERRLLPGVATAAEAGGVIRHQARQIQRIVERMDDLAGPEPGPPCAR